MKKLKKRYYRWKEWRRYSKYNWFQNVLVFLGIKKSKWFDAFMINPFMTNGDLDEDDIKGKN